MDVDYNLNYNHIGERRRFKLSKKRRLKVIDSSSWTENDLKNQWYFKDYKSFYIVISKFKDNKFRVSCSGANVGDFKDLESAKVAAISFCDKIL